MALGCLPAVLDLDLHVDPRNCSPWSFGEYHGGAQVRRRCSPISRVACLIRLQASPWVTATLKVRPVSVAIRRTAASCWGVAGALLQSARPGWPARCRRRLPALCICLRVVVLTVALLWRGRHGAGSGQAKREAPWWLPLAQIDRHGYGCAVLGYAVRPLRRAALFTEPSTRLRLHGLHGGRGSLSVSSPRLMESRWNSEQVHSRLPRRGAGTALSRYCGEPTAHGPGTGKGDPCSGSCGAGSICARGLRSRGGPGYRGARATEGRLRGTGHGTGMGPKRSVRRPGVTSTDTRALHGATHHDPARRAGFRSLKRFLS